MPDEPPNDLRHRIATLETGLHKVQETRPSDATVRAWTETLQQQVNSVRTDIGRLDNRIAKLDDNIDAFREAMRAESVARRNQLISIVGLVVSGVVVSLILAGIGAISVG